MGGVYEIVNPSDNALSRLRSLELIVGRGQLMASDDLMCEGPRG